MNLKIAIRNLKKNKGFTAINMIGLAIGMAAALLILLWVNFQFSVNRTFPKVDQLFVVGTKAPSDNGIAAWFSIAKPLGPVLKSDIPEIKDMTRLSSATGFLFTAGEKKLFPEVGAFVDSSFLSMFDLPVFTGDVKQVLKDPNQIVLTEKLANDLFGSTDVVGKTLRLDSAALLTVSAVLKDIPQEIGFAGYAYFLPWTFMEKAGLSDNHWGNSSVQAFVEVEKQANIPAIQSKLKDIVSRHSDIKVETFIKPVSDMYLYSKYENGEVVGGRISMVKTFILIAGFILLIACINFMNLSTAQSERRAKEVGIRKVVGAQKKTLIFQFLSESILMALISGVIALLLVVLSLPSFNDLVGQKFQIPFADYKFWALFLGFILLTGVLAGIYPAFFLSSFTPIKVLKGRFRQIQHKINPRKILVVTQFCVAIVLIVSTLVIRKQVQYAQDRDYGFEQQNLIYVSEVGKIADNSVSIKQALLSRNIAQSVTRMMSPITERWSGWGGFLWEGKDPNDDTQFNRQTADDKVVETAGFELVKGRDFDLSKFPTDSSAAIINETAAKKMGFTDPIGKIIDDSGDKFHVIGVIKDFVQESPFDPIKPLIIEGASHWMNTMHIRFNPQLSTKEALERTEQVFKEFNSEYPFEYSFVDEAYALKFKEIEKTGKLATLFAGLTIFISCLGLFGLAAYMAESRTKEIGIRKVLGASVFSVTRMLSKEFLILVITSCIIAFPIAYWAMDKYLEDYTYRINISWGIFILAGVGAILITLLSISYQSIKAAIANPVDSLRDE
ncbi:ABC transporter permease [Sphingobacterium lactis]|uniref:ABC transporter permease n=1 Tax=Sphingobacterium lactis TaxID=797291 RepID=UPI003F81826A